MTEFLTDVDLASYLERDVNGAITNIADRTNALIDQEWANPTDPVPEWVKNIAWDVALRAGTNPTGVTSTTRSWDDVTRTDRFESGVRNGVYLTDEEARLLHGSAGTTTSAPVAAKSIRMVVPGWTTPKDYPCY